MITVTFNGDEDIIKSDQSVYQWDTGQKVTINGLSDSSINYIHFSFKGLKTAYVVGATNTSGTITVIIPNIVLRYGKDVYMYLCIRNSNGNVVTVKTVIIPVIKRNMPENYMYDDDETVATSLDELQAEIQRSTAVDTEHETRITSLEEAKTNASGTTFETLKQRLDEDYTTLSNKVTNLKSTFELLNVIKSVSVAPYAVLTNCHNAPIFDTSLVSGVCDAVAVVNGNNLLYPDALTVGSKTLSNGATLTVNDDYTIEYDGTNATKNITFDVMSNGAWRYVFPFSLTLSCKFFDVSNGGFNVYAYYNDGSDHAVGFVTRGLTIPANSKLFRVYITTNNKEVKFKVKININKSDEIHSYEKPNLKLIDVSNFKNTVLEEGKNWIFPYSGEFIKVPISTVESISYITKENKTYGVYETKTQYATINEALSAYNYNNGDCVLVNHGTYSEKIENRNTPKRLIGIDTDLVIITGSGDDYDNPPIEIAYGMMKNLTVIENQSTGAYCLHIDANEIENNTLIVENCKFVISGSTHAIGIGNRAGSKIVFKNCEIVSNSEGLPIYMHNTESVGTTLAQMIFENCTFVSNSDIAIRLQDWNGCCETEFLFINNTFITTDISNAVNIQYRSYGGTSSEDSHEFKNKFSLSNGSHGNNVSYLNK